MTGILQIIWALLVLVNFTFQMLYFFRDSNRTLYLGKRITTPALLFGAMFLALFSGTSSWISITVFIMMGLGELGIEGSSVVEDSRKEGRAKKREEIQVTLAGALFLLVNMLIGVTLLAGHGLILILPVFLGSLLFYSLLGVFFFRRCHPSDERKFQIKTYSLSLIVLLAGVLADFLSGMTALGTAGAVLCLSDSLVLVRMGAGFSKEAKGGFRILLIFLMVILLLYYSYMVLLMGGAGY